MPKLSGTWNQVTPQTFTADGTAAGMVTIASTIGFYSFQQAIIKGSGLPNKVVQVKRVISNTTMLVGPLDDHSTRITAVDLYTVAAGSTIEAPEQKINLDITSGEFQESVYENSPIAAVRTTLVDEVGNKYNASNPLPFTFDGTIAVGEVEITGPSGHLLDPNANGSLNTINLAQLVPVAFNEVDLTNSVIAGQTVPTTVVYKQGATTVATLVLSYDGSANLLSVVRS